MIDTTTTAQAPNTSKQKWLLLVYCVWATVLSAVYFALLVLHITAYIPIVWGAIGVSAVAAIFAGVIINKPALKSPWLLFAAANAAFISGDIYFKFLHYIANRQNPYPSVADLLYLSTYPLFAVGMYILVRRRAPARNNAGNILDALTLTISLAVFVWVYLVIPNANAVDTPFLARMTSIAYPLGDVLVWALLMPLLVVDVRTRATQLLAVGALGLIVADIAYGLGQYYGFWVEGNPVDIGWILFYTAWGAAALHPSMAQLTQSLPLQTAQIHARRLVLLAGAALVAPGILLVESLRGLGTQVSGTVAVFSAVLFILVIMRLYILSRELSRREADERLNQEKNEVVAVTSHQLRTPLTIIQLYGEALAHDLDHNPERTRHDLATIVDANQRLVEIVNRLVYVTELDTGLLKFNLVPTAVGEVIHNALLDNDPLLKKKNARLTLDIPANLPPVLSDAEGLRAALGNVIGNAFEYNSAASPQVVVSAKVEPGAIVISIADNGAGIPKEDQEKLFNKMFRGSNARLLLPDGSGLGLYLTKNILDQLNHRVSLVSTPDKGTIVNITVPIVLPVVS